MFYLLENNIIVDSEKLSVRVNEYQGNQYLARDSKNRYVLGKIKKQSENVFDLIDWEEDLVRVDDAVCHCKYFSKLLREEYIKHKWFNAIYKLDANENYIKVWEKKENESKRM